MKRPTDELNIIQLLDELRTMAQLGLNYTKDEFDKVRFEKLLEIASKKYATFSGTNHLEVYDGFRNDLGHITPKVSVNAALFNDVGELLLEKRSDDQCWGLPGGYGDIDESPEESIVREFKEETGLDIQPAKVIGIYTRLAGQHDYPHTLWQILYSCIPQGGQLTVSDENLELKFKTIRPDLNWHKDHYRMALAAQEFLKTKL